MSSISPLPLPSCTHRNGDPGKRVVKAWVRSGSSGVVPDRSGSRPTMRFGERVRKIEREDRLDPLISRVKKIAERLPTGTVRDVLHGVQFGHPLHSILVHLPIGTWTSAVLLDLLPGPNERSAHTLVNIGLLATLPAAVSGLADWSQQHERQQRVGVVHAMSNGMGALLFGASSLARANGHKSWGKALALAGMGTVGFGGALVDTSPTPCGRRQQGRPLHRRAARGLARPGALGPLPAGRDGRGRRGRCARGGHAYGRHGLGAVGFVPTHGCTPVRG